MQVEQLVVPLCYYSEGVLDEGHDDEEAADGREVTVSEKREPGQRHPAQETLEAAQAATRARTA